MKTNFQRVLVLAPHTDDGELGLGATINRFVEEGKQVYYAAFSTADQSVPEGYPKNILSIEVRNATNILGIRPEHLFVYQYEVRKLSYSRQEILEDMVRLGREVSPELVFLPCLHDVHQDHTTVAQEGVRAFKNMTILGYELIWNNLTFNTDCFIRIEERHVEAKCLALHEYRSQGAKRYLSDDFIRSLATTRGVQAGCQYAEAFEVVRLYL